MSDRKTQEEAAAVNAAVRLRSATEADWSLLRTWITRADVQRWWGSPASAEASIRVVFETPSAIARIVEFNGKPVGYAHAIDSTFWGEDLPIGMAPSTWDIDLVIAEPNFRGRGVGRAAVDLLANEVFTTTFALALSVIVPVKNEAAIRAYENAGFKWARVWNDPIQGASWLLLRQRPATQ